MAAPRTVSIYTLAHPVTKKVMYVGQTRNPGMRRLQHLSPGASFSIQSWVLELRAQGLAPEMKIVESVSEEDAASAERTWIGKCRVAGKLLNVAGISNGTRCRDWNGHVRGVGWLKKELKKRAKDAR